MALHSRHVHDDVYGERDGFANAVVGESNVRGEHAMCHSRECLFGLVRVNGAEAPEVPRIEGLQQVERFGAAHFADDDAVGPVTEGGAE